MKSLFSLVFSVFAISFATGQKLKTVTINHKSPYEFTERFQVLKSDNSIKQGKYIKRSKGFTLLEGTYKDNQRAGVWTVYESGAVTYYQYDYDKKELINYSKTHIDGFKEDDFDVPPLLKGGHQELLINLYTNIRYPVKARERNIQGKVVLEIEISKEGKSKAINVQESAHNSLTEEALRVMELVKNNMEWFPAIKDGEEVGATFVFPVHFRLQG